MLSLIPQQQENLKLENDTLLLGLINHSVTTLNVRVGYMQSKGLEMTCAMRLIPYKHNAIQMNLIHTNLTEDLSEDRLEQFPADYELQKTFVTWIA